MKKQIQEFIKNNEIQKKKVLDWVPRIGRWNGEGMHYSLQTMLAEAECCIRALDRGSEPIPGNADIQKLYRELIHVTGMGYGYLWAFGHVMIGELWRINDFTTMIERSMQYLGRDYLWLNIKKDSEQDMKDAIIYAIQNNRPVVMEFAGMLPEFNVVTGYDNYGDTLIGWTFCDELVDKTEPNGMFIKPAQWDNSESKKYNKYKALIIGEKNGSSLSDKHMIQYGLDTMKREVSQDTAYTAYTAGDKAYMEWLEFVKLKQQGETIFNEIYRKKQSEGIAPGYMNLPLFEFYLDINSLHTKQCVAEYYKELSNKYPSITEVKSITQEMLDAIEEMTRLRNHVGSIIDQNTDWSVINKAWEEYILKMIKTNNVMQECMNKLINILPDNQFDS